MGELVGVGGIYIPSENIMSLERSLNGLCRKVGFPVGDEFKWSPDRKGWMHNQLKGKERETFICDVFRFCWESRVTAVVIASETTAKHPAIYTNHEDYVTQILIERIERLANSVGRDVVVVFDRPGGNKADEDSFLERCLETIQNGTPYRRFSRIALNALSTSSHFIRLLQAADVLTGCVLAYIAGELTYAPPLIPFIRPLLASNAGTVGGVGIKILPDFSYLNLYHWLFGDTEVIQGNMIYTLPTAKRPYVRGADQR